MTTLKLKLKLRQVEDRLVNVHERFELPPLPILQIPYMECVIVITLNLELCRTHAWTQLLANIIIYRVS